MRKGFFISLEGFEGSGKTTIAKKLYQLLIQNNFRTLLTKEPGGTVVGDKIREILLERSQDHLGYKAELLLFAASRSENVRVNINPALERGEIVICDRYIDSTVAYQGFGRGIEIDMIHSLNHFAIGDTFPDITFFLDVDVEIGLQRSTLSNQGKEMRFEDEFMSKKQINGQLFLDRVRDGYHQIARDNPNRIKIVDSNQNSDIVLREIIILLNKELDTVFHKTILTGIE